MLANASTMALSRYGVNKMNTIILFVEYLLAPIRIVRLRILRFRRSLLKRRETRLQKRLERISDVDKNL
jgi:hypothetical protein